MLRAVALAWTASGIPSEAQEQAVVAACTTGRSSSRIDSLSTSVLLIESYAKAILVRYASVRRLPARYHVGAGHWQSLRRRVEPR